jgi:hypothetical protein
VVAVVAAPSTQSLVILSPAPLFLPGERSLFGVARTPAASRNPHFAIHPTAKTIRREFFAVHYFAVAFPSHLA